MSKLFMYGTSLEGIEQLMMMAPNFSPRRSGIVINNYFNCEVGGAKCNCYTDICFYLKERDLGGIRYKDLIQDWIDSHNFPDRILNIVPTDTTPLIKIDTLINLASHFIKMGNQDIKYIEKLMDYVKPQTIDEVLVLADPMYEFELFDRIKSAESYARYMIYESEYKSK